MKGLPIAKPGKRQMKGRGQVSVYPHDGHKVRKAKAVRAEDIETFCVVVASKTILEASAKVSLTDATISRRICALESKLKTKLFIRRYNRRMILSPQGFEYVKSAREYLMQHIRVLESVLESGYDAAIDD